MTNKKDLVNWLIYSLERYRDGHLSLDNILDVWKAFLANIESVEKN